MLAIDFQRKIEKAAYIAGGGTYTKALAEEGYTVDAVELTPRYVEEMRQLFAGRRNVRVYEGNAKDLSFLQGDAYDAVLLMGLRSRQLGGNRHQGHCQHSRSIRREKSG